MMTSHNQFRKMKYLTRKECDRPGCRNMTSARYRLCTPCEIYVMRTLGRGMETLLATHPTYWLVKDREEEE